MSCQEMHEDFRHEALFYEDFDEFVERTGSFIEDGLKRSEPALVVLGARKIDALRKRLGSDADGVRFADMAQVGSNPARIIPAWRRFVDAHSEPGGRLRGIGEPIWAERSPAELIECQRHESLLNLAFADAAGFHLLCPYDTAALAPDVIDEARRSHPHLASNGHSWESIECRSLEEVASPFAEPLPPPGGDVEWRIFQAGTLQVLRGFVAERAATVLEGEAIEDLVLAVHEVTTNSVVHGGSGGLLRVWREGDAVICEVQDGGLIENPLAGREQPTEGHRGGHGLWLANRLCDLVQIRTFSAGNVVRLHKRRG